MYKIVDGLIKKFVEWNTFILLEKGENVQTWTLGNQWVKVLPLNSVWLDYKKLNRFIWNQLLF